MVQAGLAPVEVFLAELAQGEVPPEESGRALEYLAAPAELVQAPPEYLVAQAALVLAD